MLKLSIKGMSSRKIASTLSIRKSRVNDIIKRYRAGCGLEDQSRSRKINFLKPPEITRRIDDVVIGKSIAYSRKIPIDVFAELRKKNITDIDRCIATRRSHDVKLFGGVSIEEPLIVEKNKIS